MRYLPALAFCGLSLFAYALVVAGGSVVYLLTGACFAALSYASLPQTEDEE